MTGWDDAPLVLVRPWPATPGERDVALLDPQERRRMALFDRPRDAAGFACGRALLRCAAARRLACDPAAVPLVARPGSRPRVDGATITCSITHGGGVVLAAVGAAGCVGVDVEPVDPTIGRDELAGIARDVLGAPPAEVEAIREGGRPARTFFERWTLTEAVLKALGTGLQADPREVRIDRPREGARLAAAPGVAPARAARWRLHLFEPAPGHVAALATDRPSGGPRVERLS